MQSGQVEYNLSASDNPALVREVTPASGNTRNPADRSANNRSAQQSSSGYKLAVTTSLREFHALEAEWNALFERAARPCQLFQSFAWLRHWADYYLDHRTRLCIVTGRVRGRLMLVWPLVIVRRAGLKQVTWMGEPVSQYGDVLVDRGHAELLAQSWSYVKALGVNIVHLRKVRRDSVAYPLLTEPAVVVTNSTLAPYVNLASGRDLQTFEGRCSGKTRSNLRRHLRRLNEQGLVTFEQYGCGSATLDLVAHALALKGVWLDRRGVISPSLQDGRLQQFLFAVATGCEGSPGMRVSAVRCHGRPIGIEISLECKNEVFGYILSHDFEFRKCGVGTLLAEYSIPTAHEHGYGKFDLLGPAESYKLELADATVEIADVAVPLTCGRALYLRWWLGFGRERVKRTLRFLPPSLVQMLGAIRRWWATMNSKGPEEMLAQPGSARVVTPGKGVIAAPVTQDSLQTMLSGAGAAAPPLEGFRVPLLKQPRSRGTDPAGQRLFQR
jgi:CelD/BcsL family acetyltransferase involved in cellulose biosynthesis